ncbi:hypothetical protein ACS7SF_19030 (plasmid) [Ralstonia sp. 25C]|uniref:hypothetical protein n=1 Tax=Ralstonia sp. 25C TaxID=3447363 RepID=UPI003F7522AF
MNSRLFSTVSRRTVLALVASISASAALLSQPAAATVQPNFDAPAATQSGRFDPYTQRADRLADTYGYLSWNGDASYPNGGSASRA